MGRNESNNTNPFGNEDQIKNMSEGVFSFDKDEKNV